jgi:pimeloyl-ACP methyl ester carboxylesterase
MAPAWVVMQGGRTSKDTRGIREVAVEMAERGNRVLIWDRPNAGASDVCFMGPSESVMHADVLAALLTHLDMAPAVMTGGLAGARTSLTAERHPEDAGMLSLATKARWLESLKATLDGSRRQPCCFAMVRVT